LGLAPLRPPGDRHGINSYTKLIYPSSTDGDEHPQAAARHRRSLCIGRTFTLLALVATASLVASCASSGADDATAPPTAAAGVAPELVATPTDPSELVANCAAYVPLAAYLGDASMQALWLDVGEDAGAMHVRCEEMLATNAPAVAAMSRQLVAITPTTTLPPPDGTFPPAPPGTWPAYIPQFGPTSLD
jgi:hypothetical protein